MDNLTAAKSLCNAICSSFYPDEAALRVALFNDGIDPAAEAAPKDPQVFRAAARLVAGYAEGSRSEGGVSVSVRSGDDVRQSIRIWCGHYGIDAAEVLGETQTAIDNASDLW